MSNSAARLLDVMDKLNKPKPLKEILLDFENEDVKLFVDDDNVKAGLILAKIYSLFSCVIKDVKAIPDINTELYLSWAEKVSLGLSVLNIINTNHTQSQLRSYYTEVEKRTLEFCEHELRKIRPKSIFTEEDRQSLFEQASALEQNVVKSKKLDETIKSFILNKLQDILNAIVFYDFSGDEGIIKVTERALGSCATRPDYYTSKAKTCIEFMKFLSMIMVTIQNADKCYKISTEILDNFLLK